MTVVPQCPKIYHITHVDNLSSIVATGLLFPDSEMIKQGGEAAPIGMHEIKAARRTRPVHCHPGTNVGDYVPFYFCPRSVMLYVVHMGNHPNLTYHGGQGPIVHLEADMHSVIAWARANGRRWSFASANAAAMYAQFFADERDLDKINWPAIEATDFRSSDVKEGKQAEFLVHESFPWSLVSRIGVKTIDIHGRAYAALQATNHRPTLEINPNWYY